MSTSFLNHYCWGSSKFYVSSCHSAASWLCFAVSNYLKSSCSFHCSQVSTRFNSSHLYRSKSWRGHFVTSAMSSTVHFWLYSFLRCETTCLERSHQKTLTISHLSHSHFLTPSVFLMIRHFHYQTKSSPSWIDLSWASSVSFTCRNRFVAN